MKRLLLALLFLLSIKGVTLVGLAQTQEMPAELIKLRSQFEREVIELNKQKPLAVLNDKYRKYLLDQKNAYQKAGNIKGVLAVDDELKNFEGAPAGEVASLPELKRLQGIYRDQKSEVERESLSLELQMIQAYKKSAGMLASQWTKAGNIEKAKLGLAESERFAAMENDPSLLSAIGKISAWQPIRTGRMAGEGWRNSVGIHFCWIPPGEFEMGDARVKVELTRGFWLGKYEVTQEEYEEITGINPSHFKNSGKRAPVENVTWNEAMEFCEKLTEKELKKGSLPNSWKYTLPTEAQWEYACRAGTKGNYNVEGASLGELGWYKGNSGNKTHEVGLKRANDWGVHDMHGNVREWCMDWQTSPFSPLVGGTNPIGLKNGATRVYRGGSRRSRDVYCRSAHRNGHEPNYGDFIGFRAIIVPSGSRE